MLQTSMIAAANCWPSGSCYTYITSAAIVWPKLAKCTYKMIVSWLSSGLGKYLKRTTELDCRAPDNITIVL